MAAPLVWKCTKTCGNVRKYSEMCGNAQKCVETHKPGFGHSLTVVYVVLLLVYRFSWYIVSSIRYSTVLYINIHTVQHSTVHTVPFFYKDHLLQSTVYCNDACTPHRRRCHILAVVASRHHRGSAVWHRRGSAARHRHGSAASPPGWSCIAGRTHRDVGATSKAKKQGNFEKFNLKIGKSEIVKSASGHPPGWCQGAATSRKTGRPPGIKPRRASLQTQPPRPPGKPDRTMGASASRQNVWNQAEKIKIK